MAVLLCAARKAAPTARRSVKGSEVISRARRGYDAGKKINGTKRHIAAGTTGLLLTVVITAASVQDRDAAKPLLQNFAAPSRSHAGRPDTVVDHPLPDQALPEFQAGS